MICIPDWVLLDIFLIIGVCFGFILGLTYNNFNHIQKDNQYERRIKINQLKRHIGMLERGLK
jgi:hypothetical protein